MLLQRGRQVGVPRAAARGHPLFRQLGELEGVEVDLERGGRGRGTKIQPGTPAPAIVEECHLPVVRREHTVLPGHGQIDVGQTQGIDVHGIGGCHQVQGCLRHGRLPVGRRLPVQFGELQVESGDRHLTTTLRRAPMDLAIADMQIQRRESTAAFRVAWQATLCEGLEGVMRQVQDGGIQLQCLRHQAAGGQGPPAHREADRVELPDGIATGFRCRSDPHVGRADGGRGPESQRDVATHVDRHAQLVACLSGNTLSEVVGRPEQHHGNHEKTTPTMTAARPMASAGIGWRVMGLMGPAFLACWRKCRRDGGAFPQPMIFGLARCDPFPGSHPRQTGSRGWLYVPCHRAMASGRWAEMNTWPLPWPLEKPRIEQPWMIAPTRKCLIRVTEVRLLVCSRRRRVGGRSTGCALQSDRSASSRSRGSAAWRSMSCQGSRICPSRCAILPR